MSSPAVAVPQPAEAQAAHRTSPAAVLKGFLALATGEVAARFIAFGATVYLARTLGASTYGILGFAAAIMLYLSRIADGGMEYFGLGVREIAADPSRVETLAPSLLIARLGMSAVVVLALFALVPFLPSPDGLVIALYGLTLLAIGGGTRWVLLGLQRNRRVAAARALGEATMAALVLLLVHRQADVTRVPLAQFAGDSLAAIVLFVSLRRWGYALPLRFDAPAVKRMLRQAMPLLGSALLGLVIYNSDLILLRFFRDSRTVGFYAAGYLLVSFVINVGGAFGQSLMPALTRSSERTRLYHVAWEQMALLTIPIAIGGAILARNLIGVVFGPQYAPAGVALGLLILSIPPSLGREVSTVAVVVGGGHKAVLRLTAAAAVFNLIVNLAVIPRWGLEGAALATVATEVLRCAATVYEARVVGFAAPSLRLVWRPVLAAAAMATTLLLAPSLSLWSAAPAGFVVYAAVLLLTGFRPAAAIAALRQRA